MSDMNDMRYIILEWLGNGEVGISSQAMALTAVGISHDERFGSSHPHDPADLNRCLLLLEAVPEIRNHMDRVAGLSPTWGRFIARWDELEQCFINEAGWNWSKSRSAPNTFRLMREIIEGSK